MLFPSAFLRHRPQVAAVTHIQPREKERRALFSFTLERAEIRVDREKVESAMKERIPEAWHLGNGFN